MRRKGERPDHVECGVVLDGRRRGRKQELSSEMLVKVTITMNGTGWLSKAIIGAKNEEQAPIVTIKTMAPPTYSLGITMGIRTKRHV